METQMQSLRERNSQIEGEYSKFSNMKPMIESLKDQLAMLESKNSMYQIENSNLEFESRELRLKLEQSEELRKLDQNHLHTLESQVRDMELNGTLIYSKESVGALSMEQQISDINISRVKALENELKEAKRKADQV
jgi:hypothetical protein